MYFLLCYSIKYKLTLVSELCRGSFEPLKLTLHIYGRGIARAVSVFSVAWRIMQLVNVSDAFNMNTRFLRTFYVRTYKGVVEKVSRPCA